MPDNKPGSQGSQVASPVRDYRRQTLWQVWLPLAIIIILVLLLAVLAVIGAVQGSPRVDQWGSIAAIWVIIPLLIVGLVLMALAGGLAFGVSLLLRKMPDWLLQAQLLALRGALAARKVSDTAVQPIIKVNTFSARVSTLRDRVFHRKTAVH
jgi:heme/copper-type cytochrome/quinol oxidase subunit 2